MNVSAGVGFAGAVVVLLGGEAQGGSAGGMWSRYPLCRLSNGVLDMTVLLPDASKGYYRGCRFDWSGMIARVRYKGHTFFGPWKTPHDPANSECALGPADEYGMGVFGMPAPLGYAEAKVGEPFLKIGVGLLEKGQDRPYRFGGKYRIVKPGLWRTRVGKANVEFTQAMAGLKGWGYVYRKRIGLLENAVGFAIVRSLKNTGRRTIHTTQYCHNFVVIDDKPIGASYIVRFAFPVRAKRALRGIARVRQREISFVRDLKTDEALFSDLEGFGPRSADNHVVVENTASGAGIEIKGSLPLAQFHFFAAQTCVCPEPFVELKIAPGEEAEWRSDYTLLTVPGRKGE